MKKINTLLLILFLALKCYSQCTYSAQQIIPTCSNTCLGWVQFSASGGTPPYFLIISGGPQVSFASMYDYYYACPGMLFYSITDALGNCQYLGSVLVNSVPAPVASITASGPTTVCSPATVTLNATTGTGFNYQWARNGVHISNSNSATYVASISGVYSCGVSTTFPPPLCNTWTNAIVVTIDSTVSVITPAGPTTFCSGGSVLLNANTGAGLTYQWKNNGAAIPGATNSSYTATAAGTYTVVVTSSSCSATSSATTVTVNPLPSATITPAGSTTFCTGGSVVLNAPVTANRTYQWKKGTNLISGATLSSYTATTGGWYKVTVTNTITGCSRTTSSATVVTISAKPAATIAPQGPTTFCAGGNVVLAANTGTGLTYEWKKGGNIIPGATLQNYTAITAGTYKVIVTNANTCSKTSAGTVVTVPCREGEINSGNMFDVKVFPNPSSGDFNFEILNATDEKISVNVYDIVGKLVFSESIHNLRFVIHNSKLVQGVYSAEIINGVNRKFMKLIKYN